jgi:hypothetical protein
MRNVSRRSCRGNKNTHFTFDNFFSENHAVNEIMWKNTVTDDNVVHAHCIRDKHDFRRTENVEYVLRFRGNNGSTNALQYYMYTACLVVYTSNKQSDRKLYSGRNLRIERMGKAIPWMSAIHELVVHDVNLMLKYKGQETPKHVSVPHQTCASKCTFASTVPLYLYKL